MVPEDLCSGAEVRELGGGLTREDFRCPPFKRFDAVREEPGEFPLLIVERETVARYEAVRSRGSRWSGH